ncbi:Cu(I)-responsive transcriptional regulator [Paenibacillus pasadenensis]|uniref:Cu(I)-responsive transcriptional regulator n=1 Tax=Paenibacillus pasadenensis TaxID=217090 RepID=A0A2N5NCR4_9BACL|nr:MerR family transcriptional regulator [Paenibacillus pasadenensis]PLT48137.1 Cu(I)-responsive transcriptional regulator [Paenibacillus pasadenensis]
MYKIEDIAQMTGLTKRTIRYYEEIGLLSPERSDGGYRLYGEEHVLRLRKLIDARDALGFSLQELQEYVAIHEELTRLRQAVREETGAEKRAAVLRLEDTVRQQLDVIDAKLAQIGRVRDEYRELQARIDEAKQAWRQEQE